MLNIIRTWINRYFSNEDALVLFIVLVVGFVVVLTMGQMLAPLIASIIIAFFLQGIINKLQLIKVPHLPAVLIVFILFISGLFVILLKLLPLISEQLKSLFENLPNIKNSLESALVLLPEKYPEYVSMDQLQEWLDGASSKLRNQMGDVLLKFSLATIDNVIAILIYLVLVPILVFFFLKDRKKIEKRLLAFIPSENTLLLRIGDEMNTQIANYIRGKFTEILIVGFVSYVVFFITDLNYAALLALAVGLSVVVPYIGAVVVTLPVAIVAYTQWGWTTDFFVLMGAYFVIQILDGNVLVPVLFSEAVNLHPIAIILAILVFGGLWGFWGVFFAIPLATLMKAVFHAWPRNIIDNKRINSS